MTLGEKIRNYRTKLNLTQKDLADQLNVTSQAVSRWEQDIVEPSVDTLKRMSEIFKVSLDEILSNPFAPKVSEPLPNPSPITIQQANQGSFDNRRTIGVCEQCNKPILEGDPIHRHSFRTGRTSHSKVLCGPCEQKRIANYNAEKLRVTKQKRFWGLFWGLLFSVPFAYFSFQGLFSGELNMDSFWVGLGLAYLIFSMFFTYIMDNNFIRDFFWEITSWGFVRLPGVIFSFDIDGLLFLITAKIALFFIGIGISIFAGAIALLISIGLSGFVLPFALFNAFTNPDKTQL